MSEGDTTRRGYGHLHQEARRAALEWLRENPGHPCVRCGEPMYAENARHLHLDHTDDRTTYRGLAHASCNCRAGQRRGVASRRAHRADEAQSTVINSRIW